MRMNDAGSGSGVHRGTWRSRLNNMTGRAMQRWPVVKVFLSIFLLLLSGLLMSQGASAACPPVREKLPTLEFVPVKAYKFIKHDTVCDACRPMLRDYNAEVIQYEKSIDRENEVKMKYNFAKTDSDIDVEKINKLECQMLELTHSRIGVFTLEEEREYKRLRGLQKSLIATVDIRMERLDHLYQIKLARRFSHARKLKDLLGRLNRCLDTFCGDEEGTPPKLVLPKPHELVATVSREKGEPPKLVLPEPHELVATVSREKGEPPKLVLPEPHELVATVSRDPLLTESEDKTCQFGTSDAGTCLPKKDVWICPFGVSEEGECLPGGDGFVCPFGVDDAGQCSNGPDDIVCPYGVSDAGECTSGPDDLVCPYGVSKEGECLPGGDGFVCPFGVDDAGQCSNGPDYIVCLYGVSDAGECLDKPKDDSKKKKDSGAGGVGFGQFFADLFLPHGLTGLIADEMIAIDRELEVEIVQVIPQDGNDPFDTTDPVMGGDTTVATTGTTGGTAGGGGAGGFDFNLITTPPSFFGTAGAAGGLASCAVETTNIALSGSTLTLDPFYGNGFNIPFTVSGDVATSVSNNLTILGAPGHTCTVTPSDANTFVVKCTNNSSGAMCSDRWTRF